MKTRNGARASARFTFRNHEAWRMIEPSVFRALKRRERRAQNHALPPGILVALACAAFAVTPLAIAEISLESAPPVVVRTVPPAGATDVDPGLAEIKVTFSKAMQDGSWSWSTWGEENYPETTGKPEYLKDGRTCVLPVKLQPNKFYAIWLNSQKFKNFKDTTRQPAVPYLLTFYTTADTPGAPKSTDGKRLMSLVEDFFQHNYRDITARDTLEWGEVKPDGKGNSTIRYMYRAKIWDKDTITNNEVFTFDPQGEFVSVKNLYASPEQRMRRLVEKFFGENFRDVTSRETLEWGKIVPAEHGNSSIRYKYRAKIWDKDTIIKDQVFTFDPQDKFISVEDATGGGGSGGGASTQPAPVMDPMAVKTYTVGKKIADFATTEDMSTPEAAYATLERLSTTGDQTFWNRLSTAALAKRFPVDTRRVKVSASVVAQRLNTEVVEVNVYREKMALVFARVPGATKTPIDIRHLELENGRWLNTGNDVVGSIEEARKVFPRACAYFDAAHNAHPN